MELSYNQGNRYILKSCILFCCTIPDTANIDFSIKKKKKKKERKKSQCFSKFKTGKNKVCMIILKKKIILN